MKKNLLLLALITGIGILGGCASQSTDTVNNTAYEAQSLADYSGDDYITVAKGDTMELLLQPSSGNIRWKNTKTGEYYDTTKAESDVTDYITDGKWTKAGATTLYAHYEPNTYDVTLKANTGSGSDQVVEATYDAAMPTTLKGSGSSITVHTKTGYNLLGYWDATSDGNQYYSYNVGTSTLSSSRTWNKTSATNLYAHWTPNDYAVTLSTTGETGYGSGAPDNQTATYGADMPTITPPVGAAGYKFQGYFTEANGSGIQYYNADGTSAHAWDIASATTLYAYFQKAEISLALSAAALSA